MRQTERVVRTVLGIAAGAGLVWFMIPLHWGVANIGNLAGICFCLAVLGACLFYRGIRRACARSRAARYAARTLAVLFGAAVLWAAVMTGFMVSAAAAQPPEGAAVVVLGSKVAGSSPSADLWARILAAGDYLKAHPSAVCIASGGKGGGENLTEGSVIRSCLVSLGIDPQRILTEEESASTKENFANSLRIADREHLSRSLAVVTDEYHEFRACSIARSLGAQPCAVPARTPWYIFSACWAREVLALTNYFVFG